MGTRANHPLIHIPHHFPVTQFPINSRKGGPQEGVEEEQETATDGPTGRAEGQGPSSTAGGDGEDR